MTEYTIDELFRVLKKMGFEFIPDGTETLHAASSFVQIISRNMANYSFDKIIEFTRGHPIIDRQEAINMMATDLLAITEEIIKAAPKSIKIPGAFISANARNTTVDIGCYNRMATELIDNIDQKIASYLPPKRGAAKPRGMVEKYATTDGNAPPKPPKFR